MFWTKNGVRNMRRWDTEIPVLRREYPDLQIFSCHDEYLLHTIMDVDGLLVGYGNMAPELLVEFIKAGIVDDGVGPVLLPVGAAGLHGFRVMVPGGDSDGHGMPCRAESLGGCLDAGGAGVLCPWDRRYHRGSGIISSPGVFRMWLVSSPALYALGMVPSTGCGRW